MATSTSKRQLLRELLLRIKAVEACVGAMPVPDASMGPEYHAGWRKGQATLKELVGLRVALASDVGLQ